MKRQPTIKAPVYKPVYQDTIPSIPAICRQFATNPRLKSYATVAKVPRKKSERERLLFCVGVILWLSIINFSVAIYLCLVWWLILR